jgi:hypothetical protein
MAISLFPIIAKKRLYTLHYVLLLERLNQISHRKTETNMNVKY